MRRFSISQAYIPWKVLAALAFLGLIVALQAGIADAHKPSARCGQG